MIFVRLVTLLFFVGRCEAALRSSDSFRLLPLLLALLGCFVSMGTGPLRKSGSSSESSGAPKCGHCRGEISAGDTRLQLVGQWVRLALVSIRQCMKLRLLRDFVCFARVLTESTIMVGSKVGVIIIPTKNHPKLSGNIIFSTTIRNDHKFPKPVALD